MNPDIYEKQNAHMPANRVTAGQIVARQSINLYLVRMLYWYTVRMARKIWLMIWMVDKEINHLVLKTAWWMVSFWEWLFLEV